MALALVSPGLTSWSSILDQARFFIPIITPNYFKSEACRRELHNSKTRRRRLVEMISSYQSTTFRPMCSKIKCNAKVTIWRRFSTADSTPIGENCDIPRFETRKVKLKIEGLAKQIDRARQRRGPG